MYFGLVFGLVLGGEFEPVCFQHEPACALFVGRFFGVTLATRTLWFGLAPAGLEFVPRGFEQAAREHQSVFSGRSPFNQGLSSSFYEALGTLKFT